MAEALHHHSSGRSRRTALALGGVAAFVASLAAIGAHPAILAALALLGLPLALDLWRAPQAELTLDDEALEWRHGDARARVPLAGIERVRLDTRLDGTVRATIETGQARPPRIPPPCMPPHKALEAALRDRGVAVRRRHFTLL